MAFQVKVFDKNNKLKKVIKNPVTKCDVDITEKDLDKVLNNYDLFGETDKHSDGCSNTLGDHKNV